MISRNSYLIAAILLFLIEVLIALFVRDTIIRPYGGDFLIVIFLYCLVRAVKNIGVWKVATGVLLFAYVIEAVQYLQLISMIGLEKYNVARVVLGTSFEWGDMVAYTLGILFVLIVENGKRIFAI
jgi:hypothetical protein